MNYFRGIGMFGSAFLAAHLMRGAAAAALLACAIVHQTAHPWLSLGAGVAALVALRGCPMCWTMGLVETLSQGRREATAERHATGVYPVAHPECASTNETVNMGTSFFARVLNWFKKSTPWPFHGGNTGSIPVGRASPHIEAPAHARQQLSDR